jgi:formylglycine-generating enzyme required for sulfatase activity
MKMKRGGKMKKRYAMFVMPVMAGIFFCFLLPAAAAAADKVVVIPLGGAPGNAVAADVVKGKTFSSRAAGKGVTGTLERHPMAQTHRTPTYHMQFNLIPAGTFTMGSRATEAGRDDDEGPRVSTTISRPFYMQITEVTQWQWRRVVLAAVQEGFINVDTLDEAPSFFKETNGDLKGGNPVEQVSYDEVRFWIALLNILTHKTNCLDRHSACYRLPTEAEWEYAARAGSTRAYANPYNYDYTMPVETGNGFNPNLAAMGWYDWNDTNGGYPHGTKPVARKQANSWGLYDMHGNVWEWCRDRYQEDYYGDAQRPVIDPPGPNTGSYRVYRGGSWNYSAGFARSANRNRIMPGSAAATWVSGLPCLQVSRARQESYA